MPRHLATHRLCLLSALAGSSMALACGGPSGPEVAQPSSATAATTPPFQRLVYPPTRRDEQFIEFHGVKVSDPYVWLEEADTPGSTVWPKVETWIEAQNAVTFAYLDSLPLRDTIRSRMTELWNYERFGMPSKEAGRYFYSRNSGLQRQSVVYVTGDLEGTAQVLLDPNGLSADGTIALSGSSASPCGRYWAYGLSESGSDWRTWRVRDLVAGEDLADEIRWSKFSGASWLKDGSGFVYNRYAEPGKGEAFRASDRPPQICFHRTGTPQSEDLVLFEMPDQLEWSYGAGVMDSGEFMLIGLGRVGTVNRNLSYVDLRGRSLADAHADGLRVVPLFDQLDAQYTVIDHDGDVFWVLTDLDAPTRTVVAVDIRRPERSN